MRRLARGNEAWREWGTVSGLPLMVYVVSEGWAANHPAAIAGLGRASRRAKEILASSDEEWLRIKQLTGAQDEAEVARLRDAFRAGIPQRWGAAERADAARLYGIIAEIGGESLV